MIYTDADGLVENVEYKYNKDGTLKSENLEWSDGDLGKVTYSYDADGNLVSVQYKINGDIGYTKEYYYYSNNDTAKIITTYYDSTVEVLEYSEYVTFYNENGFTDDSLIY